MKVIIFQVFLWLIIAAAVGALWHTQAHAADDVVCRPYATALLNAQMKWLWNRAYSHCQLLEEDHPVPPATGDWRAALDILDPDRTPIIPLDRADIAHIGDVPATEKPPAPIEPPLPRQAAQAAGPKPPSPGPAAAQTVCVKARMRTIYAANGHSWSCKK